MAQKPHLISVMVVKNSHPCEPQRVRERPALSGVVRPETQKVAPFVEVDMVLERVPSVKHKQVVDNSDVTWKHASLELMLGCYSMKRIKCFCLGFCEAGDEF